MATLCGNLRAARGWVGRLGVDAVDRRAAALWAPVAFGLGVQAYFLAAGEPSAAALAAAAAGAVAAAAAAVWAASRHVAAAALLLGAALAAAGFAAAGARARAVAAPVLTAEISALVEGRVAALSRSSSGRLRLSIDAPRIWGLAAEATPARVRLTLGGPAARTAVRPGDRVSVLARLGPPGGPAAPGGFDFARMAWFQRLGGVGVSVGRLVVLGSPPPDSVAARLAAARFSAAAALRAAASGEPGAVIAALTVGERAALAPATVQALRDSGLAHLLAISGLHMAMVCGLVYGAARLALAVLGGPGARAGPPAALAAIMVGAVYLAASGASVATQRAAVMALAAMGAVIAGRPALTARALAVAALVVLALRPESLISAGFQMSFAATLALVAAADAARARGWLEPPDGWARRMARYALGLAATSAIAGAATAPFVAHHFNRVAVYGLAANLLAVPLVAFVAAPALLAAVALWPLGWGGAALGVAAAALEGVLAVARGVADAPGAVAAVGPASAPALWAMVGGGLWLCQARGPARLAALAPLAAAVALWGAPTAPMALIAPGGAAVLVETPSGRVVIAAGRGRLQAQRWSERYGPPEAEAEAVREGPWLTAQARDGRRVAVFQSRFTPTPAIDTLRAMCRGGAILVVPRLETARSTPDCALIDRAALAGGVALMVSDGGAPTPVAAVRRIWRPLRP